MCAWDIREGSLRLLGGLGAGGWGRSRAPTYWPGMPLQAAATVQEKGQDSLKCVRAGHGLPLLPPAARPRPRPHLPMRGCSRSGRSMVLAMPMMLKLEPLRPGQSNRLYSTVCAGGAGMHEHAAAFPLALTPVAHTFPPLHQLLTPVDTRSPPPAATYTSCPFSCLPSCPETRRTAHPCPPARPPARRPTHRPTPRTHLRPIDQQVHFVH